jgi:hypothetical protein
MQDTSRLLDLSRLYRSPSVIRFPSIGHPGRECSLPKEEEFRPVLKTKRYNLLKLYELKHHRDRDRRLGRLSLEKERLVRLREEEEQHHIN